MKNKEDVRSSSLIKFRENSTGNQGEEQYMSPASQASY